MRFLRKKKIPSPIPDQWGELMMGEKRECQVECDYCGGYKKMEDMSYPPTYSPVLIQEESLGLKRKFCIPCWIKVFDIVLGKPNEKT